MKILALMILGLLVVGCGKEVSFTEKDIVGKYVYEINDARSKRRDGKGGYRYSGKKISVPVHFFEDGSTSFRGQYSIHGIEGLQKSNPPRWVIVEWEVHVLYEDRTNKIGKYVYVSQSTTDVYERFLSREHSVHGHLTLIAEIKDGIRKGIPKGKLLMKKTSNYSMPTKKPSK